MNRLLQIRLFFVFLMRFGGDRRHFPTPGGHPPEAYRPLSSSASHEPDDGTAANFVIVPTTNLWNNAQRLSWTDCLSSDSSLSSLCELLSNKDGSAEPVTTQPELSLTASFDAILGPPNIFFPPSTSCSGHRTLPSIGIAATLLMLGHSGYPDEEDTAECLPRSDMLSPSVPPTPITAITADDANDTFCCQALEKNADYGEVESGSGLDTALFDIAKADEHL